MCGAVSNYNSGNTWVLGQWTLVRDRSVVSEDGCSTSERQVVIYSVILSATGCN